VNGRAAALVVGLTLAVGPAAAQGVRASGLGAPPGALSCTGCHVGAGGGAGSGEMLPKLAGRPADELLAAFTAFRSGERPATIMNRISRGFTDEEAQAISVWLSQQN
jgi:cytochrome c553